MDTIKTKLHHYRFNLDRAEEASAYAELRKNTLLKIGFRAWLTDLSHGYTANPSGWKYAEKIKKAEGVIELETKHLFADQWNSAPITGVSETGLRLYNWDEYKYANKDIKEGYYLDQTPAMAAVLKGRIACGYCGKQELRESGLKFCPHCLDSSYLKAADLHLLRMRGVSDTASRAQLTDAERDYLIPLYKSAQQHGTTERGKQRIAGLRADIAKEYEKAVHVATVKRDGFTWLYDHGLNTDNVIYYDHRDEFSFGWRNNGIDPVLIDDLQTSLADFPFSYEIKCSDGRVLSNRKGE